MRCRYYCTNQISLFCLKALNLSFILHQSQSLHSTVIMHENKWVFFGVIITVLFITLLFTQLVRSSVFYLNHPSNYYAYKKATYASYILHQIMVFRYFNSIYQTSIVYPSLGEKGKKKYLRTK